MTSSNHLEYPLRTISRPVPISGARGLLLERHTRARTATRDMACILATLIRRDRTAHLTLSAPP
jgi:hypothetical protein